MILIYKQQKFDFIILIMINYALYHLVISTKTGQILNSFNLYKYMHNLHTYLLPYNVTLPTVVIQLLTNI